MIQEIQKEDMRLTTREIVDLAVSVKAFIQVEAGHLQKQISGIEISAIAGVLETLSYEE
ncbi:TPA: hypothetical protein QHZ91_001480 [Enterobacter hormaechei subsp. xiangfangensis]|uniref:hypothetical protein n=1 Tax=Enterobacter hormaechei TaxID=158836 RepID=UPI00079B0D35|nr:hypothetical protein [Enterobacter hormaechei]SAC06845.1 Uncharacterised protein [Enterobacter hormaechei]HDS5129578.1 hypothetical protein [Enterobacter hormaechei subsp. xiangfangensis]